MPRLQLAPHHIPPTHNVRTIYIQHLTDLLHVCLSKGDYTRAKRAWAILIRCREVDWKSRWYWGLLLLDPPAADGSNADPLAGGTPIAATLISTQTTLQPSQVHATQTPAQTQSDGREAERWLKALRVSSPEAQRPAILHALVLHMIKHDRHRAALDELETYLSSYPYLTSAPLHVYAGMLCFYLAQPESARRLASDAPGPQRYRADSVLSSPSAESTPEPPNMGRLRSAKGWFIKALELDRAEPVSLEFLQLIRELDKDGVLGDDGAAAWARTDVSSDSEDDQVMLDATYPTRPADEDDGLSTDSEADSIPRRNQNGDTSFRSEMDSTPELESPIQRIGGAARAQGRVDPRLAFRLSADSDAEDNGVASGGPRADVNAKRKNGAGPGLPRGGGVRKGDPEVDGLNTGSGEDLFQEDDGLSSD